MLDEKRITSLLKRKESTTKTKQKGKDVMTAKPMYPIHTDFGMIFGAPNAGKELELTTHPQRRHLRKGGMLTVRNIAYNVALTVRMNGDRLDGVSIGEDNETETFVSAAGPNEAAQIEAKVNALSISRINPIGRDVVSPYACTTIYDAVLEAVNNFYLNNKIQIDTDWKILDEEEAAELAAKPAGATNGTAQVTVPQQPLTTQGAAATTRSVPTKEEPVELPASGPSRMHALLKEETRLWGRLDEITKEVAAERAKLMHPHTELVAAR